MERQDVVKVLLVEFASAVEDTRLAIEQQLIHLADLWRDTERKHEASLRESKSDSWSRALLSVYEERRLKHDAARSQLESRLTLLSGAAAGKTSSLAAIKHHLCLIKAVISSYESVLAVKRRQLELAGEYGNVESHKWHSEIGQFIANNPRMRESILELDAHCQTLGVAFDWAAHLMSFVDKVVKPAQHLPEPSRSDGIGFERACLASLISAGWQANITKASGDQGVDIIARKDEMSIAVQCKNQNIPVGNGAVQEVHAGKTFYETDFAVVVSASGFTPSAVQLAQTLGVHLVDSSILNTLDERLRS